MRNTSVKIWLQLGCKTKRLINYLAVIPLKNSIYVNSNIQSALDLFD